MEITVISRSCHLLHPGNGYAGIWNGRVSMVQLSDILQPIHLNIKHHGGDNPEDSNHQGGTMKQFILAGILIFSVGRPAWASVRIEEERLINLDSTYTQGFLKARFDFQHSWLEGDLNPIADFTLIVGLLPRLDLQFEALPHNLKARTFDKIVESQSNAWEWALKWQVWNQHAEDPLSVAISAHYWRYDRKAKFTNLRTNTTEGPLKSHFITTGGQAIVSYDFGFVGPTAVLKWFQRDQTHQFSQSTEEFLVPAVGAWVKLFTYKKDVIVHLVGDYHFKTVPSLEAAGAKKAWGGGIRIMYHSPHIYTFFVTNNSGDLWEESIFGTEYLYYSFRWSYRF